jgi:hypothetical protein
MKPAIDRLEHWVEHLAKEPCPRAAGLHIEQVRLALADVKDELEARTRRSCELYDQGAAWRQVVGLCEHGSVCEVGFWQAGNRRWFAQVKLMSGDELEPRSGETPEEAVRNAVEMVEQRETAAAEDG